MEGQGQELSGLCPTELPRMNSWAKGQLHFCEMPDLGLCLGLSVTSKERASRYLTMITASSVAWVSMLRENPDFTDGVSNEVAWTLKELLWVFKTNLTNKTNLQNQFNRGILTLWQQSGTTKYHSLQSFLSWRTSVEWNDAVTTSFSHGQLFWVRSNFLPTKLYYV